MSSEQPIDVLGIVEKYLRDNGYDGLFNDDQCGCYLGELAPCENGIHECRPGYKVKCTEDSDTEWCICVEKREECEIWV